ncbi:MAG: alpha/beta hydrolase, partial [Pseudomonadota bacterium]
SRATVDEMQARHPDLVFAEVPDRGHVPFLNEPQSLDVIRKVLAAT